jgi:hypothetical protein
MAPEFVIFRWGHHDRRADYRYGLPYRIIVPGDISRFT